MGQAVSASSEKRERTEKESQGSDSVEQKRSQGGGVGALRKAEGQPFSQGGWPSASFTVHRACAQPEGGRLIDSARVLGQKPEMLCPLNERRLNPGDATGGAPDLPRR